MVKKLQHQEKIAISPNCKIVDFWSKMKWVNVSKYSQVDKKFYYISLNLRLQQLSNLATVAPVNHILATKTKS